jgi:broad specificity phosphatase PhoE
MRLVAAIQNDKVLFDDNSTMELPHQNDTSYTTLFFVRHAEKQQDGSTDPDLMAEGYARATRLGKILAQANIDTVFSTPYQRCRLTAQPTLEHAIHQNIRLYRPEDQVALLEALADGAEGQKVLIVVHQNTVPMGLNYLVGDFPHKNISDYDYGKFYIAITKGIGETQVLELRY